MSTLQQDARDGGGFQVADDRGEWIYRGPRSEMERIFHGLCGPNGRPWDAYTSYLRWMRQEFAQRWPGWDDPYAAGRSITLATANGEVLLRHVFPVEGQAEAAGAALVRAGGELEKSGEPDKATHLHGRRP